MSSEAHIKWFMKIATPQTDDFFSECFDFKWAVCFDEM